MTPLRQRTLEDLQIRHYSPTTIRLYLYAVRAFAKHFGKPPDQLGAEHIRRYQLFLTKEKKVSTSTYVMMICGLRFFYTHTLHRKVAIERIPFPRRERRLPLILSRDEIKALLEAPSDLRDRAMLAILYGSGLRVSEVTRIKVADIDSARNVLWVRFGKGRKDRQALLPPKLRELLRCYWRSRQPTEWLFPGARPGQPIAVKTVYKVDSTSGQTSATITGTYSPTPEQKVGLSFTGYVLGQAQKNLPFAGILLNRGEQARKILLTDFGSGGACPIGRGGYRASRPSRKAADFKPGHTERNCVMYLNPGSAGPWRFQLPITVAPRFTHATMGVEFIDLSQ